MLPTTRAITRTTAKTTAKTTSGVSTLCSPASCAKMLAFKTSGSQPSARRLSCRVARLTICRRSCEAPYESKVDWIHITASVDLGQTEGGALGLRLRSCLARIRCPGWNPSCLAQSSWQSRIRMARCQAMSRPCWGTSVGQTSTWMQNPPEPGGGCRSHKFLHPLWPRSPASAELQVVVVVVGGGGGGGVVVVPLLLLAVIVALAPAGACRSTSKVEPIVVVLQWW